MQIKKLNKKGQNYLGLELGHEFVLGLLVVVVLGVVAIIVFNSLAGTNLFPAGSGGANATAQITGNASQSIATFSTNFPTFFVILGVTILIIIISLAIAVVKGFGRGQ